MERLKEDKTGVIINEFLFWQRSSCIYVGLPCELSKPNSIFKQTM
jgi:hypothetical protein